jgi:hypothetical protein
MLGLSAPEGCSGAAAAARLKMRVAQVYVAESEVKSMIRAGVRSLEETE